MGWGRGRGRGVDESKQKSLVESKLKNVSPLLKTVFRSQNLQPPESRSRAVQEWHQWDDRTRFAPARSLLGNNTRLQKLTHGPLVQQSIKNESIKMKNEKMTTAWSICDCCQTAIGGSPTAVGGGLAAAGGHGIVLTWVDLCRSAHSTAPLAPYNFNNNGCLQPADGVHNGQTASTCGRQCAQTAWVFPTQPE